MCGVPTMLISGAGYALSGTGHALYYAGNVAFELTVGSLRQLSGPKGDRPGIHLAKIVIKTAMVAAIVGLIASYASISPVIPFILVALSTFRYLIKEEFDWDSESKLQQSLVTGDCWYNKVLSKIFEDPYAANVSGDAFPKL